MNPHNLSPGTCCTSIIVNWNLVIVLLNLHESWWFWRTTRCVWMRTWSRDQAVLLLLHYLQCNVALHDTVSSSIECTGALTGGRRVTYAPRSVSISPTLLPYCSFSASYSAITQPKSSTINRELSEHLQKRLKTLKWFLTAEIFWNCIQRVMNIEILVTTSITKNMSSS